MSDTEFSAELVERCAEAGLPSFRSAGYLKGSMELDAMVRAVLRESGHAELVAALTDIGVYGCGMLNQPAAMNGPEEEWLKRRIREYEDRARAALRKAGAL